MEFSRIEWNNQKILLFLELLKRERPIWDPTDNNHRSKMKTWAAWKRLSKLLDNTPVQELKAKKRSLMATFRPLLKRKVASLQAGYTGDDVYQPSWFAFDIMESFLGNIYDFDEATDVVQRKPQKKPSTSYRTQEDDNEFNDDDYISIKEEYNELLNKRKRLAESSDTEPTNNTPTANTQTHSNPTNYFETERAQKSISESFKTLTKVLDNRKEEDECDLYAKLLAKKLRRYPEEVRLKLMYSIDGLMIDNPYPEEEGS